MKILDAWSLEIAPHGILVARAALEVALEVGLHIQHLLDVVHRERLALVDGQRLCRAHRVFDLPPVELVPRQCRVVLLGEGHQVDLLEHPHTLDEDLEDGPLGFLGEVVGAEGDVDAGLEGISERLTPPC